MGWLQPDTPADRNYGTETRDTLQAQIDLAPQQLAATKATQPGYDALNLQSLNNQLFGTGGQQGYMSIYEQMAPRLAALDQQSINSQRASDIGAVEQLGGRATQAMLDANPYNRSLLSKLNSYASSGMDDPYSLTAEQQRQVQQASRAAMAARGMGGTNSAVADEVLRQYQASGAEAQRKFGNAASMVQLNQGVVGDPFQQILGRNSGATAQAMAATGAGQNTAGGIGSATSSMFDPTNAYASDVFNTNYNAQAAANIAGANNRAAMVSGGMQAMKPSC